MKGTATLPNPKEADDTDWNTHNVERHPTDGDRSPNDPVANEALLRHIGDHEELVRTDFDAFESSKELGAQGRVDEEKNHDHNLQR